MSGIGRLPDSAHQFLPAGHAPREGCFGQTACEGVRPHRWRIDEPNGPTVAARCVQCGKAREYVTAPESPVVAAFRMHREGAAG